MFVLLVSIVVGSNGDTFDLVLSEDHCNCDADCEDTQGCLTNTTESDLFVITSNTRSVIAEAHEEGFNGICTTLYFNDAIMATSMTEDCTSQLPEPEEEDEEEEEEQEEEQEEEEEEEETEEEEEQEEEEETEEETDPAEDVVNVIKQVSGNSNTTLPEEGNGGIDMSITTATIVAGTVIVVGFFGLMAWMAFLLQKKGR
jgi:archaellum component FlaD/FlaE